MNVWVNHIAPGPGLLGALKESARQTEWFITFYSEACSPWGGCNDAGSGTSKVQRELEPLCVCVCMCVYLCVCMCVYVNSALSSHPAPEHLPRKLSCPLPPLPPHTLSHVPPAPHSVTSRCSQRASLLPIKASQSSWKQLE